MVRAKRIEKKNINIFFLCTRVLVFLNIPCPKTPHYYKVLTNSPNAQPFYSPNVLVEDPDIIGIIVIGKVDNGALLVVLQAILRI